MAIGVLNSYDIIKITNPLEMKRALLAWIDWVEFCGHDALKKKAKKFNVDSAPYL